MTLIRSSITEAEKYLADELRLVMTKLGRPPADASSEDTKMTHAFNQLNTDRIKLLSKAERIFGRGKAILEGYLNDHELEGGPSSQQ